MSALLARRGPDDRGLWRDELGQVCFGFRRLAILDLTQAGHQPMVSASGRSVIVFNGEIYNYRELKSELEGRGRQFRSRSDTEVLVEALELWGIDAIHRLNGMFAFAWYNTLTRQLVLARDHAGIKPLYYHVHPKGNRIAFGSQFDCLLYCPWGEVGNVRMDVLRLYLQLHHIPPPLAFFENTWQLEPGSYLTASPDREVEKHSWWQIPEHPQPDLEDNAAVEQLDVEITNAVQRQRIADVPLGVYLSGGVDSPLIAAIAARQTGPRLKAFTIGNPGWWQDESKDAKAYAKSIEVDHRVENTFGENSLETINDVVAAQHEPFADFSIIPTLQISEYARKEVTVALSGDGGDELFFGYERPLSLLRSGTAFRYPWLIRAALYGAGKYGLGPKQSGAILDRDPGHYYFGVNCRLRESDLRELAPGLPAIPEEYRLYQFRGKVDLRRLAEFSRRAEFYGQLQRGLKKADMASMYHSLEVRVPLLDRNVIELALRIDPFTCMRNGTRKSVLRDLLGRYVPPAIIPTPKRGFAVPLGDWMRGPLRPLVEDTLLGNELYPSGVFNRQAVQRYWEDHLSGRRDLKWGLWTLMTLQWWASNRLVAQRSKCA